MIDTDSAAFEAALRRLSGSLQKRWKPDEWRNVVGIYFDALKHADLSDVLAAVPTLQARSRWPKVGDWLAVLPVRAPMPVGSRVMRGPEVDEYMRARREHYHDVPCSCILCQSAGVTHLPLRFVPDFTPDDVEEQAFCPPFNRMVTPGHWAHGEELRRWYAAKQAFADRVPKTYGGVLQLVAGREPGEDG